jgi:hypothetical protein
MISHNRFPAATLWTPGAVKREITVDWGIAIAVYVIVGALVARSIARVGRSGLRYERSRRLAS